MNTAPSKPIEQAFICFAGELEAGLREATFKMETYWDPSCFNDPVTSLSDFRREIGELYERWGNSAPVVTFDFELEEMNRIADAAEHEQYTNEEMYKYGPKP